MPARLTTTTTIMATRARAASTVTIPASDGHLRKECEATEGA